MAHPFANSQAKKCPRASGFDAPPVMVPNRLCNGTKMMMYEIALKPGKIFCYVSYTRKTKDFTFPGCRLILDGKTVASRRSEDARALVLGWSRYPGMGIRGKGRH